MIINKIAAKRRVQVRKKLLKAALQNMKTERWRYLSLREVCDLLDVALETVKVKPGTDPDAPFTNICAWDYYLLPGCLYAALPLYANLTPQKAMARGAAALLTDQQIEDFPCVVVPDVMQAYCRLCGAIKNRMDTRTIAVTGSVGKTTTKDMVQAVCSRKYKTFCDVENNNMTTLVGYLVQRIPADCGCYIQETHEGDPGAAESVSHILRPGIAVVTNIGESHLGNFGSYAGLIKGVTDITAGMPADGVVILDADDELSATAAWDRRTIRVSLKDPSADYYADNIQTTQVGLKFDIVHGGICTPVELKMSGLHNVTDAMLAFAAGIQAGVSPEQAVQGIGSYTPRGMRQNIVHDRSRTIYIDCFNASVKSMQSALQTLCQLPLKEKARRVAVLGDMAELGEDSETMHRKVGAMAAEAGVDVLICYGENSAAMAREARNSQTLRVFHTTSMRELTELIRRQVGASDAVLFKASHSTNLAAAIKACYPVTYFRAIYVDRIRRHFARTSSLK